MSFLSDRYNRHVRFGERIFNNAPVDLLPPLSVQPVQINTKPVDTLPDAPAPKSRKKPKFEISDDKTQIIKDIINKKPNINDCRKALKKYAEIADDERYESD